MKFGEGKEAWLARQKEMRKPSIVGSSMGLPPVGIQKLPTSAPGAAAGSLGVQPSAAQSQLIAQLQQAQLQQIMAAQMQQVAAQNPLAAQLQQAQLQQLMVAQLQQVASAQNPQMQQQNPL